MEEKYSEDIGEQVISKLKELNEILRKIMEKKHAKKCAHSPVIRNAPIN